MRGTAAAAAFAGLLALYLATPDRAYVFDGVLFSAVIERLTGSWRESLLNPRHLLFNSFIMLLRDTLARWGIEMRAYPLMQMLNAVLGVLGAGLYYQLLRGMKVERSIGALAACALALSHSYWGRATEGQVYMMMSCWSLASLYFAASFIREDTPVAAYGLVLSTSGAILFHAANSALFPAVVTALALSRKRWSHLWAWGTIPAVIIIVALSYQRAFDINSVPALKNIFSEILDHAQRQAGNPRLVHLFCYLHSSLLAGSCQAMGGLVLAVGASVAAVRTWRHKERRWQILLFAAYGCGFAALETIWFGGTFFGVPPLMAIISLVALAASESSTRSSSHAVYRIRIGCLLAAALGAWNFYVGIFPRSLVANNTGYHQNLWIGRHTVAAGRIILTGLGVPNSKVYLPYFAKRGVDVLEYYLMRWPKSEALRRFSFFLESQKRQGVPLYILPDMIEDEAVAVQMQERWGITRGEIKACFGPGHVVKVAERDHALAVHLFIPDNDREKLFAVLVLSALTLEDDSLSREVLMVLRHMWSSADAAGRSGILTTLRQSRYGGFLFLEQLVAQDPANGHNDKSLQRYLSWQLTPDFQTRLDALFLQLGMPTR